MLTVTGSKIHNSSLTCSTCNSFTSKLAPQQSKDEAFLCDLGVLGGEMF